MLAAASSSAPSRRSSSTYTAESRRSARAHELPPAARRKVCAVRAHRRVEPVQAAQGLVQPHGAQHVPHHACCSGVGHAQVLPHGALEEVVAGPHERVSASSADPAGRAAYRLRAPRPCSDAPRPRGAPPPRACRRRPVRKHREAHGGNVQAHVVHHGKRVAPSVRRHPSLGLRERRAQRQVVAGTYLQAKGSPAPCDIIKHLQNILACQPRGKVRLRARRQQDKRRQAHARGHAQRAPGLQRGDTATRRVHDAHHDREARKRKQQRERPDHARAAPHGKPVTPDERVSLPDWRAARPRRQATRRRPAP